MAKEEGVVVSRKNIDSSLLPFVSSKDPFWFAAGEDGIYVLCTDFLLLSLYISRHLSTDKFKLTA